MRGDRPRCPTSDPARGLDNTLLGTIRADSRGVPLQARVDHAFPRGAVRSTHTRQVDAGYALAGRAAASTVVHVLLGLDALVRFVCRDGRRGPVTVQAGGSVDGARSHWLGAALQNPISKQDRYVPFELGAERRLRSARSLALPVKVCFHRGRRATGI